MDERVQIIIEALHSRAEPFHAHPSGKKLFAKQHLGSESQQFQVRGAVDCGPQPNQHVDADASPLEAQHPDENRFGEQRIF
ncbi:hypothetical protein B5K08_24185 [Rhizobium leguminosarum bv. trifolii]|uniref:Uncharacterized protein n=1 Tax=Rhizobium leguminosarum bv. trifolii TaxID=386 RepID=A0A3E1B6J5_RHILT|nr:hypothetical protein ATY75_23480 [Rhizobium sp. N122]RFB86403.1 hypothetical protein B5K08_24185 [Rhizobium leguminosarum bv. trifolii]RFB86662.1 hypothetical protein B5K10_24175 [Rhizobium leguminosarum bv. trifolii]